MATNNCTRCGSSKVVPRARIIDRGDWGSDYGNVQVGVARHPEALLFKALEHADLYGRVCGTCGFVELFVDSPEDVYAAYEASQTNRS